MNRLLFVSKKQFEDAFQRQLADYDLEFFEPAIKGDPEAAIRLTYGLPKDMRGLLAFYFWVHAKAPEAFRAVLEQAWSGEHRQVIEVAGTRRDLEAMFRAARFELPSEWPEKVTVYRGTSKFTFEKAKRGHSWTTSKQLAAWFAMRFASLNGSPLVLKATVPKTSILHYSNERHEQEAVCFHVRGAKIDGTPEDWEKLMDRENEERRQRRIEWLAEVQAKRNASNSTD